MVEKSYKNRFDKQLENLKRLCADLKKYQEAKVGAKSNSEEKKKAEENLKIVKNGLIEAHVGMNSAINDFDKVRQGGEIEKFWDDFVSEVMNNWDDKVPLYFCKVFDNYLNTH